MKNRQLIPMFKDGIQIDVTEEQVKQKEASGWKRKEKPKKDSKQPDESEAN